ncbi:MAG TPA: carbon-nitrogen hydrolase family protein [Selenomonadales bacterium]|nr:carbon-nitrogen hydrolase family protein [Selenomonadales bacterium]
MSNSPGSVRVAVVQAAPVIMDRAATIAKVADLTAQAAAGGAKIVVFPETFIPCYPRGLNFGAIIGSRSDAGRKDFWRFSENAVTVPGEAASLLGEIARKAGVFLVVGVVERDAEYSASTLYNTTLYFGPDGSYRGKHRKLKPTASERLIWGEGDGSTLTVVDTPYGKMGDLICWENYMPLARVALYAKGVTIYLAPTADSRESWQSTLRHIAMEGRCFVLGCNQFVTKDMYPTDLACYDELAGAPQVMCRGGSTIIGPLGQYIAEPVFDREELLVADLDLSLIQQSRYDFDVMGHYARPDVFKLLVNEEKKNGVAWIDPGKRPADAW